MHCEKNFPFKKVNSDFDVPLEEKITDDEYLQKLSLNLDSLYNIKSDIIFFQAGVDTHASDRYGKLNLSSDGLDKRNKLVYNFAQKRKNPLLIFMGGGYSIPISRTVDAFSKMFIFFSSYKF